jgi:DNA invertase Pin-like site-specific DNA recombinase
VLISVDRTNVTEQYLDSCGIFKGAVLSILATIAKQERIRISERVRAGLAKARKQGRVGGRPRLILSHAKVLAMSQEGCTIREIAEEMGVLPASIHRILKGHHRAVGDVMPA